MLTFIRTGKVFNVNINNEIFQFDDTHKNYAELVESVRTLDETKFVELFDEGDVLEQWSEGEFTYSDGVLYYQDYLVPQALSDIAIELRNDGFDYKPMLNFIEKLIENPSMRAVNELYQWLQHKCLSIDKDGYIIGYKGVTEDYLDCHSRKFLNTVGAKHSMRRNLCDDNWGVDCSNGFHVGTKQYATDFGQRVMLVKVNPKDVVSVPSDCDCQKMRCCEYEVIAEYSGKDLKRVVDLEEDDYYDEEDWDTCDDCGQDIYDCECDDIPF